MHKLLDFLKMLTDETRLRIVVLLYHKELCVCEMCQILDLSQPLVSRHLAKLRDSGFIRDRRQGQWIFYSLNIENNIQKQMVEVIVNHLDESATLQKDVQKCLTGSELCNREKI